MTDQQTTDQDEVGKSQPVWKDVAKSWMALKTWVKIWLVFLNIVLIGSFAFLHDPAGRWTAVAYIAAAPILVAIMVPMRGLSRILGLGHIVPWIPLLIYLGLRISSEAVGPRLTAEASPALFWYVIIVVATVGVGTRALAAEGLSPEGAIWAPGQRERLAEANPPLREAVTQSSTDLLREAG